jgi:hypothetical protein
LIQGATTIASTWLGTPLARSRKISSPGRAQDPRKGRAIRTTTKCQTRSSILSMPPTSPAWIPRRHGPQPTREKRAQRAKYTPTGSREPLLSSSFACSPTVSRRWVGCVFVSRDAPWRDQTFCLLRSRRSATQRLHCGTWVCVSPLRAFIRPSLSACQLFAVRRVRRACVTGFGYCERMVPRFRETLRSRKV